MGSSSAGWIRESWKSGVEGTQRWGGSFKDVGRKGRSPEGEEWKRKRNEYWASLGSGLAALIHTCKNLLEWILNTVLDAPVKGGEVGDAAAAAELAGPNGRGQPGGQAALARHLAKPAQADGGADVSARAGHGGRGAVPPGDQLLAPRVRQHQRLPVAVWGS